MYSIPTSGQELVTWMYLDAKRLGNIFPACTVTFWWHLQNAMLTVRVIGTIKQDNTHGGLRTLSGS